MAKMYSHDLRYVIEECLDLCKRIKIDKKKKKTLLLSRILEGQTVFVVKNVLFQYYPIELWIKSYQRPSAQYKMRFVQSIEWKLHNIKIISTFITVVISTFYSNGYGPENNYSFKVFFLWRLLDSNTLQTSEL